MQTFLPYPNFVASAMCLDDRRLGKQRVEAAQISNALIYRGGWINHPATRMWETYQPALTLYSDCCIREWIRRGFQNTMMIWHDLDDPATAEIEMPYWLGDPAFHAAHRAALLAKDPTHYSHHDWTEEPKIDYIWPKPREL